MTCPHARVEFCPLYVISHDGIGLGCIVARGEFECLVGTEMNYAEAVERLKAHDPRLAPTLAFKEDQAERIAQRKRNMRAMGIQ